jgi:hypothetical protein
MARRPIISEDLPLSAGTGAAQQHLLPALMRVYAAADAAVGLDVDKDAFDKFRCDVDNSICVIECSNWNAMT